MNLFLKLFASGGPPRVLLSCSPNFNGWLAFSGWEWPSFLLAFLMRLVSFVVVTGVM